MILEVQTVAPYTLFLPADTWQNTSRERRRGRSRERRRGRSRERKLKM